ncbi:MAG: glutathione S-transferase family protein [Gammaproteobacteria bacterium]
MKPTLYHHGLSTCAAKARLALAEKGVEWEARFVDIVKGESHTPEYLKLNPRGMVPTLVHDGHVICESNVICEYVDNAFDGPELVPQAPVERARMRGWMRRLDERLHFPATSVLTFAISGRRGMAEAFESKLPGAEMLPDSQPLPDGPLAELLPRSGLSAAAVTASVRSFGEAIADMEADLRQGPWLAGATFSLADIAFAPYLTRLDCLQLEWLWDERPAVADWYGRIRERPTYAAAIAAWLGPPEAIETMQRNGLAVRAALVAAAGRS